MFTWKSMESDWLLASVGIARKNQWNYLWLVFHGNLFTSVSKCQWEKEIVTGFACFILNSKQ